MSSLAGRPEPVPSARRGKPDGGGDGPGDGTARRRSATRSTKKTPSGNRSSWPRRGLDRESRLAATADAGERRPDDAPSRCSRTGDEVCIPADEVRALAPAGCVARRANAAGGSRRGRSGWTSWNTRSARARSRRRCSPRSRSEMPAEQRRRGSLRSLPSRRSGRRGPPRGGERNGSARCRSSRRPAARRRPCRARRARELAAPRARAHAAEPAGARPRRRRRRTASAKTENVESPSPLLLMSTPPLLAHGRADQRVVPLDDGTGDLGTLLPHARRSLDVGHEERDETRR